jgi:metallo-beta-lactamase class B
MKKFFYSFGFAIIACFTVFAVNPNQVELTKITDQMWIHTSYYDYNGFRTPSNGLLVQTTKGFILIDTPWTNEQTQELLNQVEQRFQKQVTLAVITHWHQDRIGGIDTLLRNHIDTLSTTLTADLASKNGYHKPQTVIELNRADSKFWKVGGTSFELFYPGPAHSIDNIVVYFPKNKVLFGGCALKSETSSDLGNIADGDLKQYPAAIQNLIKRYPEVEIIIPGHGQYGNSKLLEHTLQLAERAEPK